jgi:hypothetical protein
MTTTDREASDVMTIPGVRCPWNVEARRAVPSVLLTWGEANRLMCDLLHRGKLPDGGSGEERRMRGDDHGT